MCDAAHCIKDWQLLPTLISGCHVQSLTCRLTASNSPGPMTATRRSSGQLKYGALSLAYARLFGFWIRSGATWDTVTRSEANGSAV